MFVVDIDTYWNVEVLWQFLNAISAIMSHSSFKSAAKLMFMLGVLFGVLQWAQAKHTEWISNFFMAYVIFIIMTVAQSTVIITDKTGLEPPRSVGNVPTVLAWTAKISNTLMSWLSVKYESTFAIPSELTLPVGDLGFGHRILRQVGKAQLVDPALRADLTQFFKECTLYDVKDGAITPDMLTGNVNTWNVIFSNTSAARFVSYNTLSATPVTDTCVTVANNILNPRLTAAITATQQFYGRSMFTRASSNAIADTMYANAVQSSYSYILGLSSSASDALKQGVFNTLWREAGTELPSILNDPARVAEMSALASASIAAKSADGSHGTVAILAQETLPHVRNWIEAIIIGLFPIIVLFMIVADNNTRKAMFKGYALSFAWIGLWPVMFALINHLSLLLAAKKAAALKLATIGGVPFQLTDVYDATLLDEQTMLGYAVIMVPFLAGAVVKIASGQITQLGDKLTGTFSSAAGATGGEAAKGNFSSGNAALDTVSVNTTSMNKYDTSGSMQGGGFAIGRGDGGTMSVSANRTAALQQLANNFVKKLSYSDTNSAGNSETGTMGSNAGHRQSTDHRDFDSASLSRVKGTGSRTAVNSGTNSGTSIVVTGGTHQGKGQDGTRRTEDGTTSSASSRIDHTDRFGMQGGIHLGGGGQAAAGDGGLTPAQRRVAKTMESQGASPAQINGALAKMPGGAPKAGGKKGFSLPIPLSGQLSADTSRAYSSGVGRDWRSGDSTSGSDSQNRNTSYDVKGQITSGTTGGTQHSSDSHQAKTASRVRGAEFSSADGAYLDSSNGYQEQSRHDHTLAMAIQHDLASDPGYVEKVAKFNGMSATRFMNRNEDEMWSMMQNYAAYKMSATQSMPQQLKSGAPAPNSMTIPADAYARDKKTIRNDIGVQDSRNVKDSGYRGTGPARPSSGNGVPAAANALIEAARAGSKGDPEQMGAKPSVAPPSERHRVRDFTSPDKELGEGQFNPAGKNEDVIGQDVKGTVKDAGSRVWDGIKEIVRPKPDRKF